MGQSVAYWSDDSCVDTKECGRYLEQLRNEVCRRFGSYRTSDFYHRISLGFAEHIRYADGALFSPGVLCDLILPCSVSYENDPATAAVRCSMYGDFIDRDMDITHSCAMYVLLARDIARRIQGMSAEDVRAIASGWSGRSMNNGLGEAWRRVLKESDIIYEPDTVPDKRFWEEKPGLISRIASRGCRRICYHDGVAVHRLTVGKDEHRTPEEVFREHLSQSRHRYDDCENADLLNAIEDYLDMYLGN